jgi:hypothetical protein
MAQAARLDLDQHLLSDGVRETHILNLEISSDLVDNGCLHCYSL